MLEAGLLAEGGGLDGAGEVHFFVEGVEDATVAGIVGLAEVRWLF
jgi:hypothetical protein